MGISVRPIPGTDGFSRDTPPWYRRFDVSAWQTWTDWFRPSSVNWANFTLISIAGEIEWCMSNAEIDIGLLNFNVRFTYYWPSENRDDLNRTARLFEAGMLETTPLILGATDPAVDPPVDSNTGEPSTRDEK